MNVLKASDGTANEMRALRGYIHGVARRSQNSFAHEKQRTFGRKRFQAAHEHAVLVIDKEGNIKKQFLRVADLLRGRTYQVRDFVSLGLDVDISASRRPVHPGAHTGSPVLFARGETILMGIGGLKGLIYTDRAIFFEGSGPQRVLTENFTNELGAVLRRQAVSSEQEEEELCNDADTDGGEKNSEESSSHLTDSDFEMQVVERMLQASCDSFERRYVIYERMLQHLASDDESNDAYKLQRLVPVRDSLQQFSMEINETREVLLTLLDNEQDMLDLLLSKRQLAARDSKKLDLELHDEVELLIEYYVRVLNRTYNDVAYLQYKLNTKRELAAIALGRALFTPHSLFDEGDTGCARHLPDVYRFESAAVSCNPLNL